MQIQQYVFGRWCRVCKFNNACRGGGTGHARAEAHCMFLLMISDNNDFKTSNIQQQKYGKKQKLYFYFGLKIHLAKPRISILQ